MLGFSVLMAVLEDIHLMRLFIDVHNVMNCLRFNMIWTYSNNLVQMNGKHSLRIELVDMNGLMVALCGARKNGFVLI
jgi:hypothetical protein